MRHDYIIYLQRTNMGHTLRLFIDVKDQSALAYP
jgi:hypothetical protein